MNAEATIKQIFRKHERDLARVVADTKAGKRARDVAEEHVRPIIECMSANAGQEMDPTYIVYMVQHALQQNPRATFK